MLEPLPTVDHQDDLFYELNEATVLLDCPFCGSDDLKKALHTKGLDDGQPFRLYSIACCSCRVSNAFDDPRALFEWWNTRP